MRYEIAMIDYICNPKGKYTFLAYAYDLADAREELERLLKDFEKFFWLHYDRREEEDKVAHVLSLDPDKIIFEFVIHDTETNEYCPVKG